MEENWDPEPEEQDPATTSDEAIIDLEGDNDPNDLGLIDPNAPDETLDDDRSVNEAPPDDHSDGEPEQFVGREWDLPERETRSGRGFVVRTILRNNESYLVELSLSVAALAADFAHIERLGAVGTKNHPWPSPAPSAPKIVVRKYGRNLEFTSYTFIGLQSTKANKTSKPQGEGNDCIIHAGTSR